MSKIKMILVCADMLFKAVESIIFVWYLLNGGRENLVFLHPESGIEVSISPKKCQETSGNCILKAGTSPGVLFPLWKTLSQTIQ